jgi:hypothetical protein
MPLKRREKGANDSRKKKNRISSKKKIYHSKNHVLPFLVKSSIFLLTILSLSSFLLYENGGGFQELEGKKKFHQLKSGKREVEQDPLFDFKFIFYKA